VRLLLAVLALGVVAAAPAAADTVHLRGTAYEFNNVKVKLAGARVRVAENPALGATVKPDGTYDLAVPGGGKVTPYIDAAGHHTIYLQTFTAGGQDLANVNFQVPSDAIYQALAALLQVPVGPDGNPVECAIVSTFSTRDVRALGFDAFTAFGAHGVAGMTASVAPALPAPVYFNQDVIPDRSQPTSSKDGGVIWPVVPAGAYTISAPGFAPFAATCAPGRVVNANPPWGLHQLGRTNPIRVQAGWSARRLKAIRATHVPRGTTITASAPGHPARTLVRAATRSTLTADASKLGLRFTQTITLRATAPGYNGTLVRLRGNEVTATCVPLGETRPLARCPR
jgi:hypothetical protein